MIGDNIMLAVGAKYTLEENIQLNLYADGKYLDYGYFGLYKDKCIHAVGKVTKVIIARKKFGGLQYDSYVTEEEEEKILKLIHNDVDGLTKPAKFFFVDKFYPTEYTKVSRGSMHWGKKFNLLEIMNTLQLPSTKEIADFLNGKTWE